MIWVIGDLKFWNMLFSTGFNEWLEIWKSETCSQISIWKAMDIYTSLKDMWVLLLWSITIILKWSNNDFMDAYMRWAFLLQTGTWNISDRTRMFLAPGNLLVFLANHICVNLHENIFEKSHWANTCVCLMWLVSRTENLFILTIVGGT